MSETLPTNTATAPVPVRNPDAPVQRAMRYRRVGLRMSCLSCEVAWTGAVESECWVCEGPGVPGPPPSIYPDID